MNSCVWQPRLSSNHGMVNAPWITATQQESSMILVPGLIFRPWCLAIWVGIRALGLHLPAILPPVMTYSMVITC